MSSRHKAYKETLDRGYASEWNDDHLANFDSYIETYFLDPSPLLALSWDFSQCVLAAPPAWQLVGVATKGHAFVTFRTGALTGNLATMQLMLDGAASNVTSYDDLPTLNFSVDLDTFHTLGAVVEFGFFDSATAPFTANQDGVYFRINNDQLYAVTGSGAAETTTLIGAYSQYSNYRIDVQGTTTYFYVDDFTNPAAAHTTNFPTTDLTIKLSVISANNVDSIIRVDACALERLRKQ